MKTFAVFAALGAALFVQNASASVSIAKSAILVDRNAKIEGWEVGDIQVTYTDGHQEKITHDHTCGKPQVSTNGDMGWSVWIDHTAEPRYSHSGELLRVRLANGTIKTFKPNGLFIQKWAFAADDHVVAIEAMQHHGPESYVEYDLRTGKELGRVDGYVAFDQLPGWAKAVSDDTP